MKYIFNRQMFDSSEWDKIRGDIADEDFLPTPSGGWKNYTMDHNFDWLIKMIEKKESFCLVGGLKTMKAQATNAGGNNQNEKFVTCTVGAEVIILLEAGYRIEVPSQYQRNKHRLLYFHAPEELTQISEETKSSFLNLLENKTATAFWKIHRATYQAALNLAN